MAVKIGINGFGRIGTMAFRAAYEQPERFEIAAVAKRNADIDYMIYMLKYDSVFGKFFGKIERAEGGFLVDGKKVSVINEADASKINWQDYGAEYIVEATGVNLTRQTAGQHLIGGAKKVIISAPAKDASVPTFVYGVNDALYSSDMDVVSAASCTTNCLAPLCKVLSDNFGIKKGLMSTIHAATSKQHTVDGKNEKDWRIGRSVFGNIIPTATGAASAIGLVLPELSKKMTGIAYRVPVADVSLVDLNAELEKPASYEEICLKVKEASETYLKDVLFYVDDPVVSSDFIGNSAPCCFDAVAGVALDSSFFKLIAYYDNEWGYTCNLLRLIYAMAERDNAAK